MVGTMNATRRKTGSDRKKKGRESMAPKQSEAGRILVPYFVPEEEEVLKVSGSLKVNEGLEVYDDKIRVVVGADEDVSDVRVWDRGEGYFVQGHVGGSRGSERQSRGRGRGRGRGRKGDGRIQEKRKGDGSSIGGKRETTRKAKLSANSSPVGIMPASSSSSPVRSPPPNSSMQTPPTKSSRFAGSSFESASPSPLGLPVPNFARRVAEAAEGVREEESTLPTPGEQLKSMSVDLMRLLKI